MGHHLAGSSQVTKSPMIPRQFAKWPQGALQRHVPVEPSTCHSPDTTVTTRLKQPNNQQQQVQAQCMMCILYVLYIYIYTLYIILYIYILYIVYYIIYIIHCILYYIYYTLYIILYIYIYIIYIYDIYIYYIIYIYIERESIYIVCILVCMYVVYEKTTPVGSRRHSPGSSQGSPLRLLKLARPQHQDFTGLHPWKLKDADSFKQKWKKNNYPLVI